MLNPNTAMKILILKFCEKVKKISACCLHTTSTRERVKFDQYLETKVWVV